MLHHFDRLGKLFRIFEKAAPEDEDSIGAGAVGEIARWDRAFIVRRKDEVLAAFALIGAGQAYIARPLAAVDLPLGADRALPKIVENALQTRRNFDDRAGHLP